MGVRCWYEMRNITKQAGAELGQAQLDSKVIVEVVLEDGVEVGVEVEVKDEDQLLVRVAELYRVVSSIRALL